MVVWSKYEDLPSPQGVCFKFFTKARSGSHKSSFIIVVWSVWPMGVLRSLSHSALRFLCVSKRRMSRDSMKKAQARPAFINSQVIIACALVLGENLLRALLPLTLR